MRIAICDDDFAEVKMISQHIRSHKHPHEVTLFASPILRHALRTRLSLLPLLVPAPQLVFTLCVVRLL